MLALAVALVVFVALFLFTVGVLVGRGLALDRLSAITGCKDVARAAEIPPVAAAPVAVAKPDPAPVPVAEKSAPAAVPAPEPPPVSTAAGAFTVQVASYATERDAAERVLVLRKLGFPYAYFSAKELGGQNETWFRVWLGYFPDFDSAKKSGELLQQRGEVRNYLVRKTDTAG